jgi:hypothetical protein
MSGSDSDSSDSYRNSSDSYVSDTGSDYQFTKARKVKKRRLASPVKAKGKAKGKAKAKAKGKGKKKVVEDVESAGEEDSDSNTTKIPTNPPPSGPGVEEIKYPNRHPLLGQVYLVRNFEGLDKPEGWQGEDAILIYQDGSQEGHLALENAILNREFELKGDETCMSQYGITSKNSCSCLYC